jgi:hypothetical protein
VMESYRLLQMMAEAQSYLAGLPPARRTDPRINVVIALFERDRGNEGSARQFLAQAAQSMPNSPVAAAAARPMSEWPRTLAELTAERVEGVAR